MHHHDTAEDGFVLAARTSELLRTAGTVTLVTNSRAVPADHFRTLLPRADDVFIVFNRHRFTLGPDLAPHTVWVHRLDEASGRFFGESAPDAAFHHLRVAGAEPRRAALPADTSYLSYRAPLPDLRAYPVGRRLLVPQHRVRRIVSPSTGFVVLALLMELQRRGAGFRLRAVGVGREFDGWPGHAWAFERKRLRDCGIDFRAPDGRAAGCHTAVDRLPYELVRAASKLKPW